MYTECPHCNHGICWCHGRSVYYPDVDEGEEEHGEIQCPECEGFMVVD